VGPLQGGSAITGAAHESLMRPLTRREIGPRP